MERVSGCGTLPSTTPPLVRNTPCAELTVPPVGLVAFQPTVIDVPCVSATCALVGDGVTEVTAACAMPLASSANHKIFRIESVICPSRSEGWQPRHRCSEEDLEVVLTVDGVGLVV